MFNTRYISLAVLGGIALSLTAVSPAALAGPSGKPAKKAAPAASATQYECQKCHMRYSAAVAKKNKFIDPMDGGKLLPVKTAPKLSQPKKK